MRIKYNKITKLYEVIDSYFGSVIFNGTLGDCRKFKNQNI